MDWRAAVAVGMLIGMGSGVVFAKEYQALRATASVATSAPAAPTPATGPLPVGTASFPNVGVAPPPGPNDPAMELLAQNPYTARLNGYKAALTVDGEHPLLEDPYTETMRFTNPYENTVGVANPYVDALREAQQQAKLEKPPSRSRRR
jgi:hypothetical protein